MRIKSYLYIVLTLISSPACAGQVGHTTSPYEAEAEALCDAFNPETWGVDWQSMNPVQKAQMLTNKIQSAIHSDAMKKIYLTLIHDKSKNAYKNYAQNVSTLLGEPYSCAAIQDYFSISFN